MAQQRAPHVSVARWPQDRSAAVSLTFDDAVNSQLDNVAPILRKRHLNATFFVNTGRGPWTERSAEWKKLASDGNELANHTVNHPCLLLQIEPHAQDYTPAKMEADIRDAAAAITSLTSSRRGLTFAYPCGNMSFGPPQDQVRNSALYMEYVARYSFAARGVNGGGQDPDEMNVLNVNDVGNTAGKDGTALIAMGTPTWQAHIWAVYTFHGVGGDWLSVSTEALDTLAAYLEQHSEIWTTTFGDAIRYTMERQAMKLATKSNPDGSLDVSLTWPMDARIYDLPLTVKVAFPSPVAASAATLDGKAIETKLREENGVSVILADVAPHTKLLHITARK
jgi:peptidoglycan/xylan/chitin deacetylase (PgdA/CDA1 family)